MAYRRNPMPTTGALFITNPRRRSNGRMNLMVAKELGYGGGKSGSERARKLKSKAGKSRKKAASDLRKYKAAYKAAGGNKRRAALKKSAPSRRARIRTWKSTISASKRSTPAGRRAFKAIVIDGKSPSSKSKTRRSSAKKTSWNAFRAAHKGQGYSREELSAMYRRKNPRRRRNGLALKTNPRRRRRNGLAMKRNGLALKTNRRRKNRAARRRTNSNAAKAMKMFQSGKAPSLKAAWRKVKANPSRRRRRKNPAHARKSSHRSLAMKRNTRRRRNGTHKGQVRKTARRAYMKKNRRRTARRRNGMHFGGLALKATPAAKTGFAPFDMVSKAISSVPVVGPPVAPYAAPLLVGSASAVAIYYIADKTEDMLPEMLQPYALPLLGVAGAVVTLAQPFGKTQTKRLFAAGMATVAGGIFAYQRMSEMAAAKGAVQAEAEMAMVEESEGLAGLAMMQNPYTHVPLGGKGYGAYAYEGGALNNPAHYGAYEYTGEGALNNPGHASSDYSDAHYGDAHYAGHDFDSAEGQAFLGGLPMWYRRFGRPGRRMYKRGRGMPYSHHAGRHGHRWGWLIKLVGFEGARKLAAMPPAQRMAAIRQLKAFAQAKLKELMNPSLALNEVPDAPSVYEEMGPSGAHGYGAFIYEGGDL